MAKSLDEFRAAVPGYIERAKAAGDSDLTINNRIKWEYTNLVAERQAEADKAEKDRQYSLDERATRLSEETARNKAPETKDVSVDGVTKTAQWNPNTGKYEILEPIDPNEARDAQWKDQVNAGDVESDTREKEDAAKQNTLQPAPNMSTNNGPVNTMGSNFQPVAQQSTQTVDQDQQNRLGNALNTVTNTGEWNVFPRIKQLGTEVLKAAPYKGYEQFKNIGNAWLQNMQKQLGAMF